MNNLSGATWVEFLKARRSKMPLLTFLVFLLIPFVGGFFIWVIKDPELAQRLGVISMKAQIIGGSADWPTFMGILTQAVAIGGFILFSLIASWVFGREFADHTINDLLALPTTRAAFVLAKFFLILLWSLALTAVVTLLGLGVGWVMKLPAVEVAVIWSAAVVLAVTAALTIVLVTPIAFVASAGRGYLPPMGAAILAMILSQVVAATGWGEYFPWAVPALYSGTAGPAYAELGAISFVLVLLVGLLGMTATFAWWERADQTY